MASALRFGGLALALALLFAPAWLLERYGARTSGEREVLIRIFRIHGLGLGQSAGQVAREFPDVRISMIPGTVGVPPRLNGYLLREGAVRDGGRTGRRDFTLAFTGPARGFRMYSLVVNETDVSPPRIAEAVREARAALGREPRFAVFTDRRRFMVRHVRAYRWGEPGGVTYSLYIERIEPADGAAVLYLMHILNDGTVFEDERGSSPGSAGDTQPMNREGAPNREEGDE